MRSQDILKRILKNDGEFCLSRIFTQQMHLRYDTAFLKVSASGTIYILIDELVNTRVSYLVIISAKDFQVGHYPEVEFNFHLAVSADAELNDFFRDESQFCSIRSFSEEGSNNIQIKLFTNDYPIYKGHPRILYISLNNNLYYLIFVSDGNIFDIRMFDTPLSEEEIKRNKWIQVNVDELFS